eukprot:9578638-Lingulodinium_polyedra.AAC.1
MPASAHLPLPATALEQRLEAIGRMGSGWNNVARAAVAKYLQHHPSAAAPAAALEPADPSQLIQCALRKALIAKPQKLAAHASRVHGARKPSGPTCWAITAWPASACSGP